MISPFLVDLNAVEMISCRDGGRVLIQYHVDLEIAVIIFFRCS